MLELTDSAALDALVDDIGKIDILVNNAGIFDVKPFEELTAENFLLSYEIDVVASTELIRRALPKMAKCASIFNLASVATLTKSLAIKFAPRGIRVNAIAPGAVNTPMLHDKNPAADVIHNHVPLGGVGEPKDIADPVGF